MDSPSSRGRYLKSSKERSLFEELDWQDQIFDLGLARRPMRSRSSCAHKKRTKNRENDAPHAKKNLLRLSLPTNGQTTRDSTQNYSDESNLSINNIMMMKANTQQSITEPLDNDVLCGRGGLSNKHPGNRLFRRLVHENRVVYQQTIAPSHKQFLVLSILEAIRNKGGRFVRKEGGRWIEIPRREAAVKASQALRETTDSPDSESCDSSSTSSTRSVQSLRYSKEAIREQRQYGKIPTRSSFVLAQSLFSIADDLLNTSEHSSELDECDFEPIRLCKQQGEGATMATTRSPIPELRDEDDFEPIVINPEQGATEMFSQELGDLIVGAMTGGSKTDGGLFDGFII